MHHNYRLGLLLHPRKVRVAGQNQSIASKSILSTQVVSVSVLDPAESLRNLQIQSPTFVFNLVAIFISWCADTKIYPNPTWYSTHMNLLTQSKWFSLSIGPMIANIGYSSAFMHAGWNEWADKLDSLSILLLFLWLELFSLCKFSLMIVGWTEDNAIWHICAGTGVMCLYFFFLSENFSMVRRLEDNDISGVHINQMSEEFDDEGL